MWWFVFRYVLNRELLCFTKSRQKRIPKNLQLCFSFVCWRESIRLRPRRKKKNKRKLFTMCSCFRSCKIDRSKTNVIRKKKNKYWKKLVPVLALDILVYFFFLFLCVSVKYEIFLSYILIVYSVCLLLILTSLKKIIKFRFFIYFSILKTGYFLRVRNKTLIFAFFFFFSFLFVLLESKVFHD